MGQSRAKVMLHTSGGLFLDNGNKESPHVTCEVRQMKRLVWKNCPGNGCSSDEMEKLETKKARGTMTMNLENEFKYTCMVI